MKLMPIRLTDINVNFDFTSDCGFWKDFWKGNEGRGRGAVDPDRESATLRKCQQALWSKPLPNGDFFDVSFDDAYLSYEDIRLSSDSISNSFRNYRNYWYMIDNCIEVYGEELYQPNTEKWFRSTYTIGGEMLFPRHANNVNQLRGKNPYIVDRWDLTLECIHRYYIGITDEKENPLAKALVRDKAFFDLFVDFRGYCDFFLLQDWVSADYSEVKMIIPTKEFSVKNPFPDRFERYMTWLHESERRVELRNKRIQAYIDSRVEFEKQRIKAEEPYGLIKE